MTYGIVQNLDKGILIGNKKISILFFADDIAVLAENKEDLELMLRTQYMIIVLFGDLNLT